MAHYAFLDSNNIVTEVIVGKDEGEGGIDWEQHYGDFRGQACKRTSYNTYAGVHSNGGTSAITAGGSGGSGVVIISYPSTYGNLTNIGAGLTYAITSSGGNTIYTFTAGTGVVTV